jgi:hypothetical protein
MNETKDQPPPTPVNRLDAAIDRLEEVVHASIEQPVRRLRIAIEAQRKLAPLDEEAISVTIEKLAQRQRYEDHGRRFTLGTELDTLAGRIEHEEYRKK